MAYRDLILGAAPVDYYEMETGTGTDSGSGGKTLTLNGVTTGVTGRVGNCWSFDGVDDYAMHSAFANPTEAWTFEAWIKPNIAGVNDTPTIIRRDGTDIVLLRVRGSSMALNPGQVEVYIDGTTLLSGSSYRVDDNAWHHVAYTQSGSDAKLYVDGVERATATTSQSTFTFGSGNWYVGSAGLSEYYKGLMDELAVHTTALSAGVIAQHADPSTAALVVLADSFNTGTLDSTKWQVATTANPDAVTPQLDLTTSWTEDNTGVSDKLTASINKEVLVRVKRMGSPSASGQTHIALTAPSTFTNYGTIGVNLMWEQASAGSFMFNGSWVGTAGSLPALSNTSTWYWVRAKIEGSTVSAKVWADGNAEPGTWITRDYSGESVVAGHVALYVYNGYSGGYQSVQFDDVAISGMATPMTWDADTPTVSFSTITPSFSGPTAAVVDVTTATATVQAVEPTIGLGHVVDVSTLTIAVSAGSTHEAEILDVTYVDLPSIDNYQVNMSTGALGGSGTTRHVTTTYGVYNKFDIPAEILAGEIVSAEFHYYGTSESSPVGLTATLMTEFNASYPHASTLGEQVSAPTGTGAKTVSFEDTDPSDFDGVLLRITSGTYTTASMTNATTANRPYLRIAYVADAMSDSVDLDTPTISYTANDAIAEITNPTSVDITVPTVSAWLGAPDAAFEEIRTAVLYPTSDLTRTQATETWVNNTNYMEISYNSVLDASPVLVPSGTASQDAVVNRILEHIDFPLELLVPGINAYTGNNYLPIIWQNIPEGEGAGGFILGQFTGTAIILDNSLEFMPQAYTGAVLAHEIGHAVDMFYLTNSQRVSIWNAINPGTTDDLPAGTTVTNGVNLKNGKGWTGYGDYFDDYIGEAYANCFVEAYSDFPAWETQFAANATDAACDAVRQIVTPSMPYTRGPFPTRTAAGRMYFAPLPAAAVAGTVVSANLRLNVVLNSTGGNYQVATIDPTGRIADTSAWVTTTLSSGSRTIDLTSVFNTDDSVIHVEPVPSSSSRLIRITSMDGGNTSTEPQLTVRYAVSQGAVVADADHPTTSLAAYDTTVETVVSPDVYVDVTTPVIVAEGREPVVSIPVSVDLSSTDTVMLGAYDPEIELNNSAIIVLDTPRTIYNRPVLTDVNGEPVVGAESDDPYFESTMRTFGGGIGRSSLGYFTTDPSWSEWYRGDVITDGYKILDRAYFPPTPQSPGPVMYLEDVVKQNDGPEGRHSLHFNGDAYAKVDGYSPGSGGITSNVEFTIRTERSTQFLFGGFSGSVVGGGGGGALYPGELWMVDGYLEARYFINTTEGQNGPVWDPNSYKSYRSLTKIDDGQWHHIVWQSSHRNVARDVGGGSPINPAAGYEAELYIDGRLDVRKRNNAPVMMDVIYVGGRAEDYYMRGGNFSGGYPMNPIPTSHRFIGDLTELVVRYGRTINEDEILIQRDNMFGVVPVRVDGARMNVRSHEAVVKGNKPRLLILHFGQWGYLRDMALDKDPTINLVYDKMEYGLDKIITTERTSPAVYLGWVGYGEHDAPNTPSYPTGSVMWTTQYVRFDKDGAEFKDEVTDNYRLVDLEKDLNMDDFDLISVVGFPTSNYAWGIYDTLDAWSQEPKIPMRKQIENLMAQIRDQVIAGKSLYVNDPATAIALGIVDRVEYVPNFVEVASFDKRLGAQVGYMDWHSYATDPFFGGRPDVPIEQQSAARADGESGTAGDYLGKKYFNKTQANRAARYLDWHANTKQRVRNLVQGLTSIGGWIMTDRISWINVNPVAAIPFEDSVAWTDRSAGLSVGDEFIMVGGYDHDVSDNNGLSTIVDKAYGWAASPMSAVKVGTVVTTFAPVFYVTPSQEWVNEMAEDLEGEVIEMEDVYETMSADRAFGNPYQNHATSIAIQPGDVWNGQIVAGKAYINFTEAYTHLPEEIGTAGIVPLTHRDFDASKSLGIGDVITYTDGGKWTVEAKHLKYQSSTYWGTWGGSEIIFESDTGSGPDWGWGPGGERGSSSGGLSGGAGSAFIHTWKPMFGYQETISTPTMYQRGFKWLLSTLDVSGNAYVDVETAELTTNVGAGHTAEAQRNEEVGVESARVIVQSYTDLDTIDPDALAMVSTPAVTLVAHFPVTEFEAETASVLVFTSDPEQENTAIGWTEALVMTLPRQGEILVLEDA